MKYYINGQLLFVDMVTPYRYAVMEGDRVITCQQSRKDAESVAYRQRIYREGIIAQFDRALSLEETTRIGQTPDRMARVIRAFSSGVPPARSPFWQRVKPNCSGVST